MARPPTYQSAEEKPVTVSARVPVELYAQAKAYAGQRRMSLTDVLLDGLRLRLETPAGPRDIIVAQDNTVIQELHGMVDAAVEAALARERTRAPSRDMPTLVPAPAAPIPDLSHDCNITVIQEKDAAPPDEDLILSNPPGAIDAQIA